VIEAALGEARRDRRADSSRAMARDAADFVPPPRRAVSSRARSARLTAVDFDPAWLAASRPRRAAGARSTRCSRSSARCARRAVGLRHRRRAAARRSLVNRWLEVVFSEASEDDHAALAQAAAYIAAQALGRYLA
jgi:hypothetical protein